MGKKVVFANNGIVSAINKFNRNMTDKIGMLREDLESNHDIVKFVENNRWILGAPWSFESGGPRMKWGVNDEVEETMPRPYLFQPLRDNTQYVAYIKCRQSEFTENHINKSLFYAITKRARITHIFPTDDTAKAVSNEKIIPAIEESPKLRQRAKKIAVFSTQFQNSGIYNVTGALKKAQGRGQSPDILIWDEWDLIPEGIRGPYKESLSHSKFQYEWFISTPTSLGTGIDAKFAEGTGYRWFFKCPKCGKVQQWEWPDNLWWKDGRKKRKIIDLDNLYEPTTINSDDPEYHRQVDKVYLGCSNQDCGEYINRARPYYVDGGFWEPERKALIDHFASYSVVAGMIPWKTGKELLYQWHTYRRYEWQFYNEVWGIAYQKSGSRLSVNDLQNDYVMRKWRMSMGYVSTMRNISIGIDWGSVTGSWLTVRATGFDPEKPELSCVVYVEHINEENLQALGYTGKIENQDEEHVARVIKLAEIFQANIIINDANGMGIDRHLKLKRRFPTKVWGAWWNTAEQKSQLTGTIQINNMHVEPNFQKGKNGEAGKVTMSQIQMVRMIQREYKEGDTGIPMIVGEEAKIINTFIQHHTNLGIQPLWDAKYDREYEAIRQYGEHHLMDADMYARVGQFYLTRYGSGRVGFIT